MDGVAVTVTAQRNEGRKSRDFRLFVLGQCATALGSSFTAFALPLLLYRQTGSPAVMGAGFAVGFLPYLLFGLLVGALADRYERRRLMAFANVCSCLVLLAAPVMTLFGPVPVGVYLAMGFLLTTFRIVTGTGTVTVVATLAGKDDLVRANGRLQAGTSAMDMLGPVIAGTAVAVVPAVDLLLVDATAFILSAVTLLLIRTPLTPDREQPGRPAGDLRGRMRELGGEIGEGLRFVLGHRVLRSVSALMVLVNFVYAGAPSQLVVLAKTHLDAGDRQLAWLYAAGSAGIVVMSLCAARISERARFPVLTLGSLSVVGLCTAALGLVPHYTAALFAWAGVAAFSALFNINALSLRQRIVPDRLLGRVTTTSMVLAWCAVPLGGMAGGLVVEGPAGVGAFYTGMGVLLVLLALGFVFSPLGSVKKVSEIV